MDPAGLIGRWAKDPYGALAALASAVRDDLRLREPALAAYAADRDRYVTRKARWASALDGGKVPAPGLALDPLALLAAMDTELGERTAGHEAKPIRVDAPDAWVVQRPIGWSTPLRQPRQLPFWLRYHHVVPALHAGLRVELRACDASLARALTAVRAAGAVRVYVAGFADAVRTNWGTTAPLYGAPALSDVAARARSIEVALTEAAAGEAQVGVLPELTVCPTAARVVPDWLTTHTHGLLLVCPGSFHEGRRNVARVYDRFGDVVHTHVKLAPERVEKGDHAIYEDIDGADRLTLLHTPLGILAVAVCLDFCEDLDPALQTLWNLVGPGLVLVPSMSNDATRRLHLARAKRLNLVHRTVSAVAIQGMDGAPTGGLVYPGGGEPELFPPEGQVRGGVRAAPLS